MKVFIMKKVAIGRSSLLAVLAVLGLGACSHGMEGYESSSLYQPVDVQVVGVSHAYCDVHDGSTLDKNSMRAPRTFTVRKSTDDLVINCIAGNMEVTKTIPAVVSSVPVWGGSASSGVKTKSKYYYPSPVLFDFSIFQQPVAVPLEPVKEEVAVSKSMTPDPVVGEDVPVSVDTEDSTVAEDVERDNLMGLLEELGGKSTQSDKVVTSDDDVVEVESSDGRPVSLAPHK